MPKYERVFTLLVACPDDVQEEAQRVYKVAEKINITLEKEHGVRLNVVGWKTHARPGIGSDPQEVINQQLPQKYDIFLGMMWARFGTATPRAGSGTEEEFENAVDRARENSSGVRIMFYFKRAPIPMDNIDLVQLGKVEEFRKRLRAKDSDRYKVINFIGVAACNSIPHETHRGPARVRPSVPWAP